MKSIHDWCAVPRSEEMLRVASMWIMVSAPSWMCFPSKAHQITARQHCAIKCRVYFVLLSSVHSQLCCVSMRLEGRTCFFFVLLIHSKSTCSVKEHSCHIIWQINFWAKKIATVSRILQFYWRPNIQSLLLLTAAKSSKFQGRPPRVHFFSLSRPPTGWKRPKFAILHKLTGL